MAYCSAQIGKRSCCCEKYSSKNSIYSHVRGSGIQFSVWLVSVTALSLELEMCQWALEEVVWLDVWEEVVALTRGLRACVCVSECHI